MTRAEQQVNSIKKEIEKLEKSLNRYKGILEKKVAKCEKIGCHWTQEEMYTKRDNNEMTDEQWAAWFEMTLTLGDVEDTEERLANAVKRFQKANGEWEHELEQNEEEQAFIERANSIEIDWAEAIEKAKAEYEEWLKNFKAECLKDGIVIDEASGFFVSGNTKEGKRFYLNRNDGWTERSNHCYSLKINGTMYFTSGTFATCYRYLKAN